ncbi:hypothetical protein SBA4_4770009 [Candidatus Sulfopaludibacter sp. SbA4]|nr:hypothetical protein SBA4_4770009 [Candidatus Sulfopaludibacter sp. SbA4]
MHRLTSTFVLGYHGCDRSIGERLLKGNPFRPSSNEYDWLGPGIYFWEANPQRGLDFARETARRRPASLGNQSHMTARTKELRGRQCAVTNKQPRRAPAQPRLCR